MDYGNHYLDPHPDDDAAELHGPPDFDTVREHVEAFASFTILAAVFFFLYCLVPA